MNEDTMTDCPTYEVISPKVRKMVIVGIAFCVFTACADNTSFDVLQDKIAISFGYAYEVIPVMMTAFILLEAMVIAISGKLSDMYGRRPVILVGASLLIIGSLTVVLSTEPIIAIIGRAVEGAGVGAIPPMAMATVADMYAPERRGRIQGIVSLIFALGMGAGPVIGGVLANTGPEGWRLVFLLNAVMTSVSIVLIFLKYPKVHNERQMSVDYGGVILLVILLTDVILFFGLYGSVSNYIIITMGIIAIPLLISFIKIEKRKGEPIISPGIFRNRIVRQGAILYFLVGFSIVSIELFTNVYAQKIIGMEVDEAGLYVLLMIAGMIVTSVITMPFIDRTGCKPWIIAGAIAFTIGMLMFSLFSTTGFASTKAYFGIGLFLCGVGLGAIAGPTITAVQNNSNQKEVGMITSSVDLFKNIGGAISTTLLTLVSSVYIYRYAGEYFSYDIVSETLKDKGLDILRYLDPSEFEKAFHGLPFIEIQNGIRYLFVDSIGLSFTVTALCTIMMIVVAITFVEKRPKERNRIDNKE